jgi:hypothetical protein
MAREQSWKRPQNEEHATAVHEALTQAGRDFRPVLWALLAWGNKHFAPERASVVIVDSQDGAEAEPVLVDRKSGRPLVAPAFRSAAGPAADARTRRRYTPLAEPEAIVRESTLSPSSPKSVQ